MNLPISIFFLIARCPWYMKESTIPDTVKIPPTIAHTFVRKCKNSTCCSSNITYTNQSKLKCVVARWKRIISIISNQENRPWWETDHSRRKHQVGIAFDLLPRSGNVLSQRTFAKSNCYNFWKIFKKRGFKQRFGDVVASSLGLTE